jgi:hypothetical protein
VLALALSPLEPSLPIAGWLPTQLLFVAFLSVTQLFLFHVLTALTENEPFIPTLRAVPIRSADNKKLHPTLFALALSPQQRKKKQQQCRLH